jgi:hypothetical protein
MSAARTRASSELETVCWAAHLHADERSCAAAVSALSSDAMSFSDAWRAWMADFAQRQPVVLEALEADQLVEIDDVSTPDARPECASEMVIGPRAPRPTGCRAPRTAESRG